MNIRKKMVFKVVIAFALTLGIFSVYENNKAEAFMEANVLTYYETITNQHTRQEVNHRYTTIQFRTNFSYTQTSKNITSVGERLLGNSRYAYTRTYRTW